MSRLTLFLLSFFIYPAAVSAQEPEAAPDPYEWIYETFQYPADRLIYGFTSPDLGAMKAPAMPAADATEADIVEFIRKSNGATSEYLKMQGLGLPKGSLAIFDPESLTLSTRLPRIAQNSVTFIIDDFLSLVERYVGIDQMIFEAPEDILRDIADRAGSGYDHSPLLEELENAVDNGEAEILNSSRIEARSGNRATVTPTGAIHYPSELEIDSKDQISYFTEESQFGTILEVDPVLGSDNETIDLNIGVTHHYAPFLRAQKAFSQRAATVFSSTVTDTFDANVTSQYTVKDGRARLMAVWKPEALENDEKEGVLQCCFVVANVVKVLPLINETLTELLENHGEKVLPIPEGKIEFENESDEIPEGMIVRRYTVPPTFLNGTRGGGRKPVGDPFAPGAAEPRFTVRVTVKDIFKSAGIQFPQGSSANYIKESSTLVVRNTPDQIDLVEAYIMSLKSGVEKSIAVTMHIVEGPGKIMRQASRKTRRISDHHEVWQELVDNPEVSIRTTQWIEARSGNRAKVEAGRLYHYPIEAGARNSSQSEDDDDDEKKTVVNSEFAGFFETERVGTSIEVDPILGADGKTIDLNFSINHDYAMPTVTNQAEPGERNVNLDGPTTQFHQANVTTQITTRSGMIRLVAHWSPEGTEKFDNTDIVQAAFIRAQVNALLDQDEGEDDSF